MKKINWILIKGYFRKNKMICIVLFAAFFGSFILSTMANVYLVNWENRISTLKETYGSYHFGFDKMTRQQAMSIKNEADVKKSTVFSIEEQLEDSIQVFHLYAERTYVDFSNVSLVSGKFPEKENQIACEGWYLYQKGYTEKNWLGAKISIDGKEFEVTGVIIDHWSKRIVGDTLLTVVSNAKYSPISTEGSYGILLEAWSNDYQKVADEISHKYSLTKDQKMENTLVMMPGNIDANGKPSGIEATLINVAATFLIVLFLWLLVLLSFLYANKLFPQFQQYEEIGLTKKAYKTPLFLFVMMIIFCNVFIAGCLPWMVCSENYKSLRWPYLGALLILSFIIACISAVAILITTKHKTKRINSPKKMCRLQKKRLYFTLSAIHFTSSPVRAALLIVVLAIGNLLFLMGTYFLTSYYQLNKPQTQYDYQIDIQQNISNDYEPKEELLLLGNMQKNSLFEIYPIYSQNIQIKLSKEILNEEYVDFLAKYVDSFVLEYENPSIKKVRIPALLVGTTKEGLRNIYQIDEELDKHSSNEFCISTQRLQIKEKKGLVYGLKKGEYIDFLKSTQEGNETFSREVTQDIHISPKILQSYTYMPIIFVDIESYIEITGENVPQTIYLNKKNGTDEEIKNYFINNPLVKFTDLDKENNLYRTQYQSMFLFFIVAMILLVMFVGIQLFSGLLMHFEINKLQYTMLQIFGIPTEKVIRVFFYDILFVTGISSLLGSLLSLLGFRLIHQYLVSHVQYYLFQIPWGLLLGVWCSICLMIVIIHIPLFMNIRKYSNIDSVHTE